jgi:uncharacterized membrane protein YkvA (DUF1232 family)
MHDFYARVRENVAGYTGQHAEYVLLLPDLVMLISRLMLDRRVDTSHKVYLGAALAYAVSPVDLLPERVFGAAGYVDDAAVLVAALHHLLSEVDQQIVLEHWSGSADLLDTVRRFLADADRLIGRSRLEKVLDALGIRPPRRGASGTGTAV